MKILTPRETIRINIFDGNRSDKGKKAFTIVESDMKEVLSLINETFKDNLEKETWRRYADSVLITVQKFTNRTKEETSFRLFRIERDKVAEKLLTTIKNYGHDAL